MITKDPLSLKQIKELIKLLDFDNVEAGIYNQLDFNNNKNKIILLQSENNPLYGHYFTYYNSNNSNYPIFYDPSGNKPGELWIKYNLNNNYQNAHKLINYFTKYNQFDYNDFNYQKNKNSQCCGQGCLLRLYWYKEGIKSNDDYKKFMFKIKKKYKYKSWDDLIVDMLNTIINSQ